MSVVLVSRKLHLLAWSQCWCLTLWRHVFPRITLLIIALTVGTKSARLGNYLLGWLLPEKQTLTRGIINDEFIIRPLAQGAMALQSLLLRGLGPLELEQDLLVAQL